MTAIDIAKALPNPFTGINLPPRKPGKPSKPATRKGKPKGK
jgi:hypothetical protein